MKKNLEKDKTIINLEKIPSESSCNTFFSIGIRDVPDTKKSG